MQQDPQKQPVILVLGDLMLDHYILGESTRISPEAPVPVVTVKDELYTLGGALNVVNNLVSLGANVFACGLIGNDKAGKMIMDQLTELHVNVDGVFTEPGRITTEKSRIMSSNQQIMRYDKEKTQEPAAVTIADIIGFIENNINQLDAIILSDYNKGVLTGEICKKVISLANKHHKKVLVDPKGINYHKYASAFLITPNKKETTEITGIVLNTDADLAKAGQHLLKELSLQHVVMTLGAKGMALYNNELHVYPTAAREVYDVTGAGDTVIAALGYALAMDMEIGEACRFANAAAAVVVGKVGCATADQTEIAMFLHDHGDTLHGKLISIDKIQGLITRLKAENKKIVFTNGCFDVLHAGHVSYLQKAKSLGDVLVLGLNSDSSVKKLKGQDRPINTQDDRSLVLSGLASVDYMVIFNEETPYHLIQLVQPDVLAKGADYKGKEIVGSDIAKEVVLIDFMEGKSTTILLEKINKLE